MGPHRSSSLAFFDLFYSVRISGGERCLRITSFLRRKVLIRWCIYHCSKAVFYQILRLLTSSSNRTCFSVSALQSILPGLFSLLFRSDRRLLPNRKCSCLRGKDQSLVLGNEKRNGLKPFSMSKVCPYRLPVSEELKQQVHPKGFDE